VAGVVTPNDSTTFGMLLALRKAGLASKAHFVGFDASEKLVQAVRSAAKWMPGLAEPSQHRLPRRQNDGLALRGQPVDRRVDTGAELATKDNLDTPEIREVTQPDPKKWLGE
jgi:ribose transport system substrate-binding protein